VVPIDFGHAFGSATQWLPVPEFVPFRLTRQMVGVLRPLGTQALLEPAMISALSVLHARREVLLRALDVFVRDPIADWAAFAARVPERGQDAMRAMALEANADETNAMALDRNERENADGSHRLARARLLDRAPQARPRQSGDDADQRSEAVEPGRQGLLSGAGAHCERLERSRRFARARRRAVRHGGGAGALLDRAGDIDRGIGTHVARMVSDLLRIEKKKSIF
jgi:hypothetical protein